MSARQPFCLLFDLDGTMTDTDHLHIEAHRTLLKRYGRNLTREEYMSGIMGFPNALIFPRFYPEESAGRHAELAEEKEALFRASVTALEPAPGLMAFLDEADRRGCKKAVVTNAPRGNAELMLNGLGLAARFDTLVIGDELAHGKPHPLPYLTGLERLGGTAGRACAFEDSASGVTAAAKAGITAFGMLMSLGEAALQNAGASFAIKDFSDVKLHSWLEGRW